MPKQLADECRQSIVLALGPAIFDRDVLPLDVSALLQPLMECCECIGGLARGPTAEKADHRHRRLLRTRRERPRDSRAAKQPDDIAPTHVEHGAHSSHYGRVCPIAAGESLGRPETF
jgi:hypothetical protein